MYNGKQGIQKSVSKWAQSTEGFRREAFWWGEQEIIAQTLFYLQASDCKN